MPAYFPFTEPSVEMHVRHPRLGWMELGGAGLFRAEVTLPLGVTVPVIAYLVWRRYAHHRAEWQAE